MQTLATITVRWMSLAALLFGPLAATGWTQTSDPESPPKVEAPLVIFHAAAADRLLQRVEAMFAAAQRDDMTERVQQWIQTTLSDLKGMDRTRPFGMMLYMKPGLSGMSAIVYLPVANLEDGLHTISFGTGNFQKVEGKANRYHITGEFNQSYTALNRNGYLFLVAQSDEAELDRNFPAPEKMVGKLNSRYDVALSLLIKSVPPATRQIFMTFLQTQTMAELQRKDNETEAAYRVRKAHGENTLELIEKIVTQGEELTLGGRINEQSGVGELELEVAGATDSKLAKFFQGMTGKRSLFANLLQQPSMLTMAMSWQLNEKQRKAFTELFNYAPDEIDRQAAKDGVEGSKSALSPLFDTLLNSAETGHLDGFVQVTGDGQGEYTFLAGARVAGGANFPKQLHESLKFAQEKFGSNDRVAAMQLDTDRIDGLPVHRVPLAPQDKPGQWMFGEGAQLYAYASTQALWLAFGGDRALPALKTAVQDAKKPATPAEERQQRVPFVFQTHGKQLVTVRSESGADAPPPNRPVAPYNARYQAEIRTAFDDQNDGLRLEVRPTDSGARLRFEFQKGWVGLLGRLIAVQMERGSNATPEPQPVPPASE